MQARFTLSNSWAGTVIGEEPGGWDKTAIKLERNRDYASLVEFYDTPLLFYGEAYKFINAVDKAKGPGATITIVIEVSENGVDYDTLFEGLLDLSTKKELDFYKLECGILRNDFWQKFMNRKSIAVNLSSAIDLDGIPRDTPLAKTLSLPSQKMRKRFSGYNAEPGIIFSPLAATDFLSLDVDTEDLSEIETKYHLPLSNGSGSDLPVELFEMAEDGRYVLDFRIEASNVWTDISGRKVYEVYSATTNGSIKVYVKLNEEPAIEFAHATYTSGSESSTVFTYSATLDLKKGDLIRIYADVTFLFDYDNTLAGKVENLWLHGVNNTGEIADWNGFTGISKYTTVTRVVPSGSTNPTYLSITADTTTEATTTPIFSISDAGASILNKIVGRNGVLKSDYLTTGCGKKFGLTRGLNLRGYSFTDKPFFLSFDDWWAGANPCLCLGLGYKKIGGTEYIEIEDRESFYNPVPLLNLNFVNKIEESYDNDGIFKKIEIGFSKWSAEVGSGLDDPQSKRVFNTRFNSIGKDDQMLSKFIAASLAIEQTRRNRIEAGKDWRLDEDTFIIALKDSMTDPELSENFSSISGLLNYETRYNLRLTAARLMKYWQKYYQGCLQWESTKFFFASGEGNFDMSSKLFNGCFGDGIQLSEKGDILAESDFYTLPLFYKFTHPLSWEEYQIIRNNRNRAIGISRTDSNHVACHIESLEYVISENKGIFTVKPGEFRFLNDNLEIPVVDESLSESTFDDTFDFTFE